MFSIPATYYFLCKKNSFTDQVALVNPHSPGINDKPEISAQHPKKALQCNLQSLLPLKTRWQHPGASPMFSRSHEREALGTQIL